MRRDINYRFLAPFFIGSIFAAALCFFWVPALDPTLWKIAIGIFLIMSAAWSFVQRILRRIKNVTAAGFASTFLSFLVGTGGVAILPLVLEHAQSRREAVSTQAACVTIQHCLKGIALTSVASPPSEFIVLLGALLCGSLVGNYIGLTWLNRLTDARHKRLQRAAIALLGFTLVASSVYELISQGT